jgi:hypothetical protein
VEGTAGAKGLRQAEAEAVGGGVWGRGRQRVTGPSCRGSLARTRPREVVLRVSECVCIPARARHPDKSVDE